MRRSVNSLETNPNSGRKLFFGLFIFPLLITVGMAVLLCGAVLLTTERETPETLIAAIKSGSPGKRWQKAFELSNELNRSKNSLRSQSLLSEMAYILRDGDHYDTKTRSYMAVALAHFRGDKGAVDALRTALRDTNDEIKLYALWSLGQLGARSASAEIIPFLNSEDSNLKEMSAYVLGALGDTSAVPGLLALLREPSANIRWNAALSLARLGDGSGASVLMEMLDRRALAQLGISGQQAEEMMINATKGLALIRNEESIRILKGLAQDDESLKVRQAAMNALQYRETQEA